MIFLKKTADIIDMINSFVGKAVSWLVVIMVLNVFIVVVLRYVFSIGWVWMQELYVWTHATIFMLGAGYTLLHDGHVRIDLIYRTASVRYKALVDIFGCIFLGLPLMYLLLMRSIPLVERSFQSLERSAEAGGLPGFYVLKAVIPVFCILFGLQIVSLLFRSIERLIDPSSSSFPKNKQQEPSL